jgi:hypothetical protein
MIRITCSSIIVDSSTGDFFGCFGIFGKKLPVGLKERVISQYCKMARNKRWVLNFKLLCMRFPANETFFQTVRGRSFVSKSNDRITLSSPPNFIFDSR